MTAYRIARPSGRSARITALAAVVAGLGVSAAFVWQASYSAFSATTAPPRPPPPGWPRR